MDFGYADVDITPAPGEELTGYGYFLNRRATGTADPLFARALAMSDGESRAAVVQLDLLGLAKDFVEEIRAEAERRYGLQPDHLMLHCTHTHSGPAARVTFGCGRPSEHFLHDLKHKLLATVEAALKDLREAESMQFFEGDFTQGFAHNRVGGPGLDDRVRGVCMDVSGARPILLMTYACHPVTMGVNREYSADYPGAVIREFNAYGTRAMFLTDCCGDINPLINAYSHGRGTSETLMVYGRDLANAVKASLSDAMGWKPARLQAVSQMVPLQMNMPDADDLWESLAKLKAQFREEPGNGQLRVDVQWHEEMLMVHQKASLEQRMCAEIQAIACGDVVFVALAAETFTHLGQIIRQALPDHHVIIGATSNGVLGYIADERDVQAQGYASHGACKLYGMPLPAVGAGEKWAQQGAEMIQKIIG